MGYRNGMKFVERIQAPAILPDNVLTYSDPEVLGGKVCFKGSRVPVQIYLEHVADGISMEEFLEDFPIVSRGVLEQFSHRYLAAAS